MEQTQLSPKTIELDERIMNKEEEQKTVEVVVFTNEEYEKTKDETKSKDPNEWIKENIIQKNTVIRSMYLSRLGIKDTKISKEMFDEINRMTKSEVTEENSKESELDQKSLKLENTYSSGGFSLNFLIKSDDEVRKNFIDKLTSMKLIKKESTKKHQSLIIFDWDDTLLATTYLGALGFVDIPPEIMATIRPLDESASRLMSKATLYGDTYIITNAAQGWVEYSSRLFLPKLHQVLIEKKVIVISARSGYEDMFPGDCHKWKVEAFLDIKKKFDSNIVTNLICLGDSHIEIDAAQVLARQFKQAMIKTIKFRENPRPDEMVKQQDLVNDKFEQIFTSIRNLTIRLEKMNDLRGPTYPHRQQFICPQHPPHVFVSYCLRCMIPLCLECQDIHTDLHYKNNIPVQLKSIQRVQEETEAKLREALGTYNRYIHSLESVIRNPIHYDRVLEEIDTAHRNIIKDINRFFVSLKQKYEDFRKMPDFHTKHAALAKRANELDDQLLTLGYQKTLEVISSVNSEKFLKDWEKDAKDVEGIVEKNKQLISSAIVSEEELQNILRYNIDRYVNGSRYLKSKGSTYGNLASSSLFKQDQLSNEIRGSSLNRSLALGTPESPGKDTDRKNDRSLSLERSPFNSLKQEINNSMANGTTMARNGLNSILKNTPQVSFAKAGDGRYSGNLSSNEGKREFSTIDSQKQSFVGRGGSIERAKTLMNSYSPIK